MTCPICEEGFLHQGFNNNIYYHICDNCGAEQATNNDVTINKLLSNKYIEGAQYTSKHYKEKPMPEMNDKLTQMLRLCREAHRGQMYGNKPYAYHLHQVVNTYRDLVKVTNTEDEDIADMACLGHDLLEDTDVTREDLLIKGFPVNVVTAIDLVTKKPDVPYEEYISKIGENELAFNVKVSDTYSNLTESLKDGNKRRILRYTTQLQKLYDAKKF